MDAPLRSERCSVRGTRPSFGTGAAGPALLRRDLAVPPVGETSLESEAGAAVMDRTWSLIDSTTVHQDGGINVSEIANGGNCGEKELVIDSNRNQIQNGTLKRADPPCSV